MATPTANTVRETAHRLADYMDQREKMADVNPAVTLDHVYRELHGIIGQLVEMDEASKILPTLYGARLVDNPADHDGTRRYVVEVYDLASDKTIATSIPINYTLHIHHALSMLNVEGHSFAMAARSYTIGPGVQGARWLVKRVKIEAEQPPVPVN